MNNWQKTAIGILILIVFAIVWFGRVKPTLKPTATTPTASQDQIPATQTISRQLVDPIPDAKDRVTKKPFGIYITPATSPVQPERFTGYHTGTDFETFPPEANVDVPFYAICDGKILVKKTASGYGGVVVQSCTINNESVTVVYGHVSLKSIAKNVGDNLTRGEQIGNLGQPPNETDGERKHLHLGIHKGIEVNILGYVPNESDLTGWLDFQKI